jgi:hypothetical protein
MRAIGRRRRCQRPAVCRILRVQQGLSIVLSLSFISLTFRAYPYCDGTPCCPEPKRPPHHGPGNWLRNCAGEPLPPRSLSASSSFFHLQHALHLLGEFRDDSSLKIMRCYLCSHRLLHLQRFVPHARASDGSSAKCPARARMLPSVRCRPRVLYMQPTRHPTLVSLKSFMRPCSSTCQTCASKLFL